MTKLICIILFASLAIYSYGQAKPDKDKERINIVCEKFMQNFKDEKISAAMQLLKQNSIIAHSTIDTLEAKIANQLTNVILPNYGSILSYQFIIERTVKDFIAKRFYVLKMENYYLKFDFTLYNSSKGWTITNFNYNEDLTEVLY